MPEPLVIVGCGGHGREILGIVSAINSADKQRWKLLGFVDDGPTKENLHRLNRLDVAFLGPCAELVELSAKYVIGIGDPRIRAHVASEIDEYKAQAAKLIHPTATVGLETTLAEGVVIFAGARVTTNVSLGRHVHINQNATIGHDAVLGDFVQVNPLAAVSGGCRIEEFVLIGTTAAVLQNLSVGVGATIGAGACVVRNVPTRTVVKGVPAKSD
ncbi:MAG TPA: acetyltransferase [Glaciihabitans sp.]|nr:acetyltransferase [Glaciihabitans sp.]